MKDEHDNRTIDFCAPKPVHCKTGRKRVHKNNAARMAAYRQRKGKKTLSVLVSPELLERLDAFMLARDETKAEVVERALQYFFRKR